MTDQPGPAGQGAGYSLQLEGAATLYQYDAGGELRPVRACDVDVSRPFFSGPGNTDTDFDQGDDPNLCASCGAGQHEQCIGGGGAVLPWVDCDCRDGACGPAGEWQELGYLTAVESSGAAGLRAQEAVRRAALVEPACTCPAGPDGRAPHWSTCPRVGLTH